MLASRTRCSGRFGRHDLNISSQGVRQQRLGPRFGDNPFTDTHTTGTLAGATFVVDDIIYDHGAQARFLANDLTAWSGPSGDIWGRAALRGSSRPGTS
jgi:hypothetical protein